MSLGPYFLMCQPSTCSHHNDQAGYVFQEPTPNIHGPVLPGPFTFTLNDEQAALQLSGSGIAHASQGDSAPCFDNGLKFVSPLADPYAPTSSPTSKQVQMHFFQVDTLADNAFLFAGVTNQGKVDWDDRHVDPANSFQCVEPTQQEMEKPEPTVISALGSFMGQLIIHDNIFGFVYHKALKARRIANYLRMFL